MGNLAIATPSLSDAATLYEGSQVASLPAENLQTRAITDKWRTDGAASMYLEADLGAAQSINLLGLLATNALATTQYRVRAATTQAALTVTPGYDSGTLTHWPQTGLDDWDETHLIHWMATAQIYRWWRVDIIDGALAYYQAGRLYLAAAWQPSVNFSWGADRAWINTSEISRSIGGNVWIDARQSYRRIDLSLEWLTEAEAYADLAPLQRLRANRQDVLVLSDPQATYLQELTIYGRLIGGTSIVRRRQGYSAKVRVEELL